MLNEVLQKKYLKFVVLCIVVVSLISLNIFLKKNYKKYSENIELETDGAWCWFQDPRVVYYNDKYDKTYFGFVNKSGDVMISSYDNENKTINSNVLHDNLQVDDHSAPSILIRNDGRLMVFYSAHTGNTMYYRISTNSEDISSWGDEKIISTNTIGGWKYTYSNPIQLLNENNKIYLFWRGGNGEQTFSTSDDNGESWNDAQTLFDVPGERPYVKLFSDGIDKIYFTFTDGHPNEVDDNSIYFAYYYNGSFYKADGTFIKKISELPMNQADVDKVYDSVASGIKAWNWDISVDQFKNPVIVYAIFPNINNHLYMYARWNGKGWDNNQITFAGDSIDGVNEPYYSGGIALDHENPSVVYLSREIDGVNEIEKWTTEDGGFNWLSESITSHSEKDNVRPVVPRKRRVDGLDVIWMYGDYPSFTKYDTALKAHFLK